MLQQPQWKHKLGLLLVRLGQSLMGSPDATVARAQTPSPSPIASSQDEALPPTHWLAMVEQHAPQWLEDSEHPQLINYRHRRHRARNNVVNKHAVAGGKVRGR